MLLTSCSCTQHDCIISRRARNLLQTQGTHVSAMSITLGSSCCRIDASCPLSASTVNAGNCTTDSQAVRLSGTAWSQLFGSQQNGSNTCCSCSVVMVAVSAAASRSVAAPAVSLPSSGLSRSVLDSCDTIKQQCILHAQQKRAGAVDVIRVSVTADVCLHTSSSCLIMTSAGQQPCKTCSPFVLAWTMPVMHVASCSVTVCRCFCFAKWGSLDLACCQRHPLTPATGQSLNEYE